MMTFFLLLLPGTFSMFAFFLYFTVSDGSSSGVLRFFLFVRSRRSVAIFWEDDEATRGIGDSPR